MLIFTYVIEDNMKKTWCKFQDLLSLQKVANEDERFLVSTSESIIYHIEKVVKQYSQVTSSTEISKALFSLTHGIGGRGLKLCIYTFHPLSSNFHGFLCNVYGVLLSFDLRGRL